MKVGVGAIGFKFIAAFQVHVLRVFVALRVCSSLNQGSSPTRAPCKRSLSVPPPASGTLIARRYDVSALTFPFWLLLNV